MWLTLLALVAGELVEEAEVCLLSLNAHRARAWEDARALRTSRADRSDAASQWDQRHRELHQWSQAHARVRHALTQVAAQTKVGRLGQPSKASLAGHDIEGFIRAQKAGADTCHGRMLEAKRTLDGVSAKVIALSDQVEAQEAIIEGNTLEIKEATEEKGESDATKEGDDDNCRNKFTEAVSGLDRYREELRELEQIADPAVRSSIAQHIDYGVEVAKHVDAVKEEFAKTNFSKSYNVSLLSDTSCQSLVSFLNARSPATPASLLAAGAPTFTALDCNATREVLQQEFNKAWVELSELLQEGTALAEGDKGDCEEFSKDDENEREAKLNSQIREGTRNIQMAREVLTALNTLLSQGQKEVEMLRAHLLELQASCELDGEVGEHLTKIRELIRSLQECPGRNDFRLQVPDENSED